MRHVSRTLSLHNCLRNNSHSMHFQTLQVYYFVFSISRSQLACKKKVELLIILC